MVEVLMVVVGTAAVSEVDTMAVVVLEADIIRNRLV
jgi:hypothetical protein